jgi:CHAT domain-containing protein
MLSYTGHAGFDARDPLSSALVLGSAERPQQWLTLRDDFTGLRLRQNLLTILNGCESGLVELDRVDKYVGLPSGSLYAGAACVLITLWAVYDLSTALLIYRFHHEWQGARSSSPTLSGAGRKTRWRIITWSIWSTATATAVRPAKFAISCRSISAVSSSSWKATR